MHYTGYAYLNPEDWFSIKEIEEFESYLYANPKAERKGDLTEYSVELEGFWLDGEMIVPDKIYVRPMYATSFDSNGNVSSSSAVHNNDNDIGYSSTHVNVKELPYFQYGSINAGNTNYPKNKKQIELHHMVLNKEMLERTTGGRRDISYDRVGLLKYRLYWAMPYRNVVEGNAIIRAD